jgi:hypothetical protein
MRYFLISYYQKPNGQMDEVVAVAGSLKRKDQQIASVILDFRDQSVLKCSMNGATVPKEWSKIRDFYYQYYQNYIDILERTYEKQDNPS